MRSVDDNSMRGAVTYRIKMTVVDVQPFGIGYAEDIVRSAAGDKLSAVVRRAFGNCVRKASRGVDGAIQHVCDGVAGFLSRKAGP